jgi:formylglycine-generating enzyme required for sulfatase activity
MDLQRAYETLGLSRDASVEAVEAAHDHLSSDYEARASAASTTAIQRRYLEARAELDTARAVVRSSLALHGDGAPEDDGLALAHAVLGLSPGASPLDVASAYVSLCEELERDLASAPTEALRRRCMEARAEVDEAYRYCIASLPGTLPGREEDAPYETQMASETFEGAETEQREVRIVPPEPLYVDEEGSLTDRSRAPRRKRWPVARFMATTLGVFLVAGLGLVGFGYATNIDVLAELRKWVPDQPDPRIVQAQGDAELARRRMTEERQEIQTRAEEARDRVARLEESLASSGSADERDALREELTGARARHALAVDLLAFAEKYVFEGSDLALAYGRIELGQELAENSHKKRALQAFDEAQTLIESALTSLDETEQALGARSEALAAREAWHDLKASAGLEDSLAAGEGGEVLTEALALLETGALEAAARELERSAQLFRVALDDGRRQLADAMPLPVEEGPDPVAAAVDRALDEVDTLRDGVEDTYTAPPPVSAAPPPPPAAARRSAIKLVVIPGGAVSAGFQLGGSLLRAFGIDRTEVRVDEYAACVLSGACSRPGTRPDCNWSDANRGDHPINCVDWEQARNYCAWVGKRLPSEQEWERAARGEDGRVFPWGDEPATCDLAVIESGAEGRGCGHGSTWPVASLESGRSPYGLFDMAGNVVEWTSDRNGGRAVVRGGSWRADLSPDAWRAEREANARDGEIGFRCAGAPQVAGDAL